MSWLRWACATAAGTLGARGIAGLAMIAGCALFCCTVILPLGEREAGLKAAASLPRPPSGGARAPVARDATAGLDAFYGTLPGEDAMNGLLATLHELGRRHGLALRQADYRAVQERGGAIGQYRISLPATATYPQVKRFLADALAALPSLSLDQLALQRRSLADATVDAQMQFTLHLRPQA